MTDVRRKYMKGVEWIPSAVGSRVAGVTGSDMACITYVFVSFFACCLPLTTTTASHDTGTEKQDTPHVHSLGGRRRAQSAVCRQAVLMLLFVRTTWKCPTGKQRTKPEDVNFDAIIAFFDDDADKQLVLPDDVIAKLTEYSFCLFDQPEE